MNRLLSNTGLNPLLSKQLGENWIQIYPSCDGWNPMPRIPPAEAEWRFIKRMIKEGFAAALLRRTGIVIDPATLLDLQDKRIHEYKRQHLNVLHITALYQRIKSDSDLDIQLRIFIFGSKAAPGYHMAKLIIKLINTVAEMVNKDPDVCDRLKLVFLPNFNICNSQRIYPAAEILEQISTAAKEASGTGNMKFTLNGALTIGTLDGANVEIRQEVGVENFFLFGLTAREVPELQVQGYSPLEISRSDTELREVIDLIRTGYFFFRGNREIFQPLVDSLLYHDPYLVLADFQSTSIARPRSARPIGTGKNGRLCRSSISRSGKFSSDRTTREYCEEI